MSTAHRPYLRDGDAAEQAEAAVEPPLPEVGQRYTMRPERGERPRTVTVTGVWDAADGTVGVSYEWRDSSPDMCRSAAPLDVFLRAYAPAAPAPQPAPAPVLSDGERSFLAFALDLASDHMASRGDEFGEDDWATLASLRKLAGGER